MVEMLQHLGIKVNFLTIFFVRSKISQAFCFWTLQMPRDINPMWSLTSGKNDQLAPLTDTEWDQLTGLLRRATWPLPSNVFRALINKTVSVPIELAVLSEKSDKILLYYRKDEEYDGNHMPGTVLRDNENVPDALRRLVDSELIDARVGDPVFVGWAEISKGNAYGQNPSRHEISLIFACRLKGHYKGSGGSLFYIDNLPDNTLSHHRILIEIVRKWLWEQGIK